MKKLLIAAICITCVPALAYVPSAARESWKLSPSVHPTRGPIRPNTVTVSEGSGIKSLMAGHKEQLTKAYWVTSVFWGKEWLDPGFSTEKTAGIDYWFDGYSNSNYSHALDEYIGAGSQFIYDGHVVDTNPQPGNSNQKLEYLEVRKEVCELIDEHRVAYVPGNSFYPIYLAKKRPVGGACSIHVTDVCGNMSHPITFALIYNLDGDASCDPQDQQTGHSQGLSAIANTSARAVADLLTDWDFIGYFDLFGNEVDDKCAWTFNVPYVTFTNGSIWKLQGLWSNKAFITGTGYPNADGDKGCLDGH